MFKRIFIALLIFVAALAAGWLALRRDDISYDALEARYADETSRFLTLENGLTVHYRDEGPSDGDVVVLIHGFSASLHTWDEWTETLSQTHRVIRFDLPGHGLTRVQPETELTTQALSEFTDDVVNALEIEDFVLVGSSMGGHTAWTYALDHQQRLNGLVLVDASGLPAQGEEEATPFVFKLIRNPVIGPLLVDLDMTTLIRNGLEDSFVDQSLVTDDMVARYAELARAPGHRKALLALATRKEENAEAQAERLTSLTVPTLIMFGDTDNLVPSSDGARFESLIPDAQLKMYENVGHLPQEEAAEESLADLQAFLASLSEPAQPVVTSENQPVEQALTD